MGSESNRSRLADFDPKDESAKKFERAVLFLVLVLIGLLINRALAESRKEHEKWLLQGPFQGFSGGFSEFLEAEHSTPQQELPHAPKLESHKAL